MKPQEFKRQLVDLGTIITDGIAYFSVWRGLMVEDEISAHALNRYRGLFLPARKHIRQLRTVTKQSDRLRNVGVPGRLSSSSNSH
jgi:hypothetical protein